jgi:RNA polymerase primary sigma factor
MKTIANKPAAGAAFPSSRLAATARSLGAARARVAGDDETAPVVEKRLKAAGPVPARAVRSIRKGAAKTAKTATKSAKATSAAQAKSSKRNTKSASTKAKPRTKRDASARTASAKSQAKRSTAKAAKKTRAGVVAKRPKASSAKSVKATAKKPASKPVTKSVKATSKQSAAARQSAKTRSARPNATPTAARVEKGSLGRARAGKANAPVVLLSHTSQANSQGPSSPKAQASVQPGARVVEVRSAPAVVPSSPATHTGRGDATLARYMSELATYELLGRDDEIRLAQEVETLEVSFWRAMLAQPRMWEVVEPAIRKGLEAEQSPTDLEGLSRAAHAAAGASPSKAAVTRYEREAESIAGQLRTADIHREAAKGTFAALQEHAENALNAHPAHSSAELKAMQAFMRDVSAARRAQQAAKDRFVAANLRLVVSMARRYAREGRMPLADLIQEGNLGLMKAVERFDHRRGFRFSTYASWWIRHALTRGLADKGRLVRLPVHALETRTRLARATRKLTCRTGVAPTIDELAAETGLDPEKLPAVEELSTEAPFSLDAPVGGDNDRTFLDMLRYEDQTSAEESVVSASHKESLVSLLGELSPFEAQILRYRYGFDGGEERTLKEIGQMYNLSRERIRQIQACALAKMRARVDEEEQREGAAL